MRRVVVTGMGVVSPLGSDLRTYREKLLAGESAGAPITLFDPAGLATRIAAQVDDANLPLRTQDRKIGFAVCAARFAIEDARDRGGDPARHYPPGSGGLSLGTGLELFSMPDLAELWESGKVPAGAEPLTFLQTPSDIGLHLISREQGLGRPPLAHISACAAATDAVGTAFEMIRDGERAWMLAGGTDSMLNPLGVGGFCKLAAMTTRNGDPKRASRPFDRERDGFLLGEGAGLLVLEPLEEAERRGARIYAEILGYGNSLDAHGISEPHPEGDGALASMQRALASAGLAAGAVSHVNAHGTATPKNDLVETRALRRLFGAGADGITVNSTKSMLGHLISASGAAELIAQIICQASGWLHPTLNLENPDPDCDLDYLKDGPRKPRGPVFLKNSFGFGGQNASLAVRMAP
jgi:3-oxoacyl-[acyl-carrier-protein] synthase II